MPKKHQKVFQQFSNDHAAYLISFSKISNLHIVYSILQYFLIGHMPRYVVIFNWPNLSQIFDSGEFVKVKRGQWSISKEKIPLRK